MRIPSSSVSSNITMIGLAATVFILLPGADFLVSRRIPVGVEYRKFKLEADFGGTLPGNVDTGGDFLFATVRGHF